MELDTVLRVKLVNIKWDTTDDEHPKGQRGLNLPKTMEVDIDASWFSDTLDNIHGQAVDAASDQTDWCIESADFHSLTLVSKVSSDDPSTHRH